MTPVTRHATKVYFLTLTSSHAVFFPRPAAASQGLGSRFKLNGMNVTVKAPAQALLQFIFLNPSLCEAFTQVVLQFGNRMCKPVHDRPKPIKAFKIASTMVQY